MSRLATPSLDIAVLLPCYNEAATIGQVVSEFRTALPDAKIYVYDNNSTDGTALKAMLAGATVVRERRQGKGHVVRRMFADIEADVYLMVDGDGTYDAASAPRLITRLIETQADMVVGARITEEKEAYRPGHRFGNKMLTGLVWGWSVDGITDEQIAGLNLNAEDHRLKLTLLLARQLIGTPRHLSQHPGGFVLTQDRLDELVPIEPARMEDRQIIEWDKDDIDELKFMKVDVLGLGMLGCMNRAFNMLRDWQVDPFLGSLRLIIETSLSPRHFPLSGHCALWSGSHRLDVSRINLERLTRLAELPHGSLELARGHAQGRSQRAHPLTWMGADRRVQPLRGG